jgi:hypothetical protein
MQPWHSVNSKYGGYNLRDGLQEAERLLKAVFVAERKEKS